MPTARTPSLEVAYLEAGPRDGPPVVLLHGFPYDVHAYDAVVPPLVSAGCRTLVPYLRGYGATRFLSPETPRSGQQAALGKDLLDLLDALEIERATLVGYDWGGRAACIVAALWPERVAGLVSATGYNIQDIAASRTPADPEQEHRLWYQFYFHTERGRAGLTAHRRSLCRLLWRLWSPSWAFDDQTYARTADAFENSDFVEVVIQSYRHRYGYAPGDPALEPIEQQLAAQPPIGVPTINLHGADDGVTPVPGITPAAGITPAGGISPIPRVMPVADVAPVRGVGSVPDVPPVASVAPGGEVDQQAPHFTGLYECRVLPGVGHNVPQEAPAAVVQAVLDLLERPS